MSKVLSTKLRMEFPGDAQAQFVEKALGQIVKSTVSGRVIAVSKGADGYEVEIDFSVDDVRIEDVRIGDKSLRTWLELKRLGLKKESE